MFKLSICTYPDKDEANLPMEYSSPTHAIAAFKETFDALNHNMTYMPVLILSYNGREIHKEAKPMHRDLDMMQVFQKVSGAI
jgi:hypothetical protein